MKCSRCGREIPEGESHPHQGQTLCEDCYISAVSLERECDPWATYLASRERGGAWPKSTKGLTELQKAVYEFIKSTGRVTREEIMTKYSLSAEDLDPHLRVLMHSELVKEHSESGTMYLIPIPVSR